MSARPKARAVFILGMHRSGTSAFARAINLLGASLGENLLPPKAENNERGFWEHREIVSTHDDILDTFGSSWQDPSPLPVGWSQALEIAPHRERLLGIWRREFSGKPVWSVKDPRLCRLFPLWRSILADLPCRPFCLLVIRNPDEVAASLAKRDCLPREISHLLWLDHMLQAEEHTRGISRAFVCFEDLLIDWRRCLDRATGVLDIQWPRSFGEIEEEMERFLSRGLRHHQVSDSEFLAQEDVPAWVRDAYRAFRRASTQPKEKDGSDGIANLGDLLRVAAVLYQEYTRPRSDVTHQLWQKMEIARKELELARKELVEQAQHYQAIIRAQQQDLEAVRLDRERIVASRSWRVTAPFRATMAVARAWLSEVKSRRRARRALVRKP